MRCLLEGKARKIGPLYVMVRYGLGMGVRVRFGGYSHDESYDDELGLGMGYG